MFSCIQNALPSFRQCRRLAIAAVAAARNDDAANASGQSTLNDRIAIFVETVVGEVSADINKLLDH